jgi:DNA-binding beta-propeller fold protein YncE
MVRGVKKLQHRIALAMTVLMCVCGAGCRHNPMYPGIGTLYITSIPSGAEVIIDGQTTQRTTPLRLDGVSEGNHELRVRFYGYKVYREVISMRGGAVKRLAVKLTRIMPRKVSAIAVPPYARQMAYDPATGRICVAAQSYFLTELLVQDSVVMPYRTIRLQTGLLPNNKRGQKLVAISPAAGNIYAVLKMDSIVVAEFGSGAIRNRFKPVAINTNFIQIRVSPNGRYIFLADSLNRRIWTLDQQQNTLGYCQLSGIPSDFLYDAQRDKFYATLSSTRQVIEVDASSGAIQRTAMTGSRPGGLAYDDAWNKISFCTSTPNRAAVMDLDSWAPAMGPAINDHNDRAVTALFAADRTHLWVVTSFTPIRTESSYLCEPGIMHLIYLPNQQRVYNCPLSLNPTTVVQTADRRYMIALHSCFDINSVDVFDLDTE